MVTSTKQPGLIWEQIMDAARERRVSVATCWASTRIAVLDSAERYEDSYAITQEFCEWITCISDHPDELEQSVLMVPRTPSKRPQFDRNATDNPLEI